MDESKIVVKQWGKKQSFLSSNLKPLKRRLIMRSYFKKKKEKKRKKQMERELRRKKQFQYNQEKKVYQIL